MQRSRPMEARTMYPRVKVQEQPDRNMLGEETTNLILKAIKSLSLDVQVPASDHGPNKKILDEDKKTNIRASSVPRPRAVLSSPDNDDMIGLQNRLSRERDRLLKGQTVRESAAGQSKPILKNVRFQSPVSTRETIKGTSDTGRSKTKPSLLHEKRAGQTPRKGNPKFQT